jgi:hypothetical protein
VHDWMLELNPNFKNLQAVAAPMAMRILSV